MMKNTFFAAALKKAASLSGRPARLLMLASRLAVKLRDVNWSDVKTLAIRDKFLVLGRLIKAYASGQYRQIPWKTMLIIAAAVIYFVNPVDLLPDLIPGLGLTDDFGVLLWVYNAVSQEIDRFLAWERSQATPI